jgi:hypothetical protein
MDCSCGRAIDDISYFDINGWASPPVRALCNPGLHPAPLQQLPEPRDSRHDGSVGDVHVAIMGRCTMIRWAPILSELLTRTVRLGTTGHARAQGYPK